MTCKRRALEEAVEYLAGLELDDRHPHRDCFIVGAPRSGTTILHQSVCYASDLGYIDNLVARFHWLPELGVNVARDIGYPKRWSGDSRFGRTSDISEPHEFGRFWQRVLGYETMIQGETGTRPLEDARAALARISAVGGRPYVYKVFSLVWRLAEFHKGHAPGSRWVHIRRDLEANARSLLGFRLARGSLEEWQSLVPRSALGHECPYEQVVAQVRGIESWIESEFAALPPDAHAVIEYDRLCAEPYAEIARVIEFFGATPDPAALERIADSITTRSRSRAAARSDTHPRIDEARLHRAVETLGR